MTTKSTNASGIKISTAELEKPSTQWAVLEVQDGIFGRAQAKWAVRAVAKDPIIDG